ncbi:hypothetical protein M378DRAFT_997914 [Amanita muscaria Koide BX008]|uniref:Uncharacterized protein n=1 Tax=Amanita muscaria (strain Koide BX008) TaxID=946122 RepID=A0A0C2SA80_AMAMK|nr:hypothetical protein M378DRAFT_997914 [Amanita muscaria Koide BX008]
MKVRSITDAQNLIELIFSLNKNQCLKSWFGALAHNATRLVLAIYGRVPLLPRSLFLNSSDLDLIEETYQGKAVDIWAETPSVEQECLDAFVWTNLSHGNMGPLLGLGFFQSWTFRVLPSIENGTLRKWRKSSNPSVSKIQQIVSLPSAFTTDAHISSRFLK